MSDQKKRVIVDGVEFGDLFFFPRILGAVTSSLQPPRLLIALFMVMALVVGGRVWDSTFQGTIPAAGLTEEEPTAESQMAYHELLKDALRRFRRDLVPQSEGGTQEEDWHPKSRDAMWVLAELPRGYDNEYDEDLPNAKEIDDEYRQFIRDIEAGAPSDPFVAMAGFTIDSFQRVVQGVVYLDAREVIGGLGDMVIQMPRGMWTHERWFTIVYGLYALLVLAIGGGALSRMAAVQVAGQERMRVRNAVDFAAGNWVKLVLAPMLPLILLFIFGLVIAVFGGALMNVPVINVVVGLGYGFYLLLGLLLSLLLLGYAAGFPMLIPAVACENCDAGDAMSRTFNYIVVRPMHYLGYAITGLFGMAIGFIIVAFVVVLTLKMTGSLFELFTSKPAVNQVATDVGIFDLSQGSVDLRERGQRWAANGIAFWQMFLIGLVAAYVLTYFFTASTTTYLLMRRACDGQDVEEIWWPGLMPGTLAPMPRTYVELSSPAQEPIDDAGDAATDDAADDDSGAKSTTASASKKKTTKKKTTKKPTSKKKTKTTSTKKATKRSTKKKS